MDLSMLGSGVGYDTKGAKDRMPLHRPIKVADASQRTRMVVRDSREGWVDTLSWTLLPFFESGMREVEFDYSEIREAGQPLKGMGGVSSGPGPLIDMVNSIRTVLHKYLDDCDGTGEEPVLTSRLIVDLMNIIGKCVVSGNVRRSAEIALGDPEDDDFVGLKNWEDPRNAYRSTWMWSSNNSLCVDDDLDQHPEAARRLFNKMKEHICVNGEPGIFFADKARRYGRLADEPDNADYRVMGTNPW
jgi:hypothetical protein